MESTRAPIGSGKWWLRDAAGWMTEEKLERGYTIILPGIEGTSYFNRGIAHGLADAEHPFAVEIVEWTTGYCPLFIFHLTALARNRAKAAMVARKITAYQDRYPGRPVQLIGHSGGGAMAILTLEALPENRKVSQAVLLAAALSPRYDLRAAMRRTERGITNFYSNYDVVSLGLGTLALGTIDRKHTVSAGAVGFKAPADLSAPERDRYLAMLHQHPYEWRMLRSVHHGGHTGVVQRRFVADYIAPITRLR